MSIEKAAAELRAGQAKIADGLSTLNQAAVLFDQARTLLTQSSHGTTRPEARQALAMLAHALEALVAQHRIAQAASAAVESYLADVASGAATVGAPSATRPVAQTPANKESTPPTVSPGRVAQLRGELPPDIVPAHQRPRGSPVPKTHGRWVGPDGTAHSIVSARDDKYREAVEWFQSQGRKVPTRASDVEMKLAVHMRRNGIRSVTLVINHVPCEDLFGCDTLVPTILPKGYTMTVHGAGGFRKTYRGASEE